MRLVPPAVGFARQAGDPRRSEGIPSWWSGRSNNQVIHNSKVCVPLCSYIYIIYIYCACPHVTIMYINTYQVLSQFAICIWHCMVGYCLRAPKDDLLGGCGQLFFLRNSLGYSEGHLNLLRNDKCSSHIKGWLSQEKKCSWLHRDTGHCQDDHQPIRGG